MLIASQPPPPSGPRTALRLIALLATRQGTDLSNENKVLIRCAWEGNPVDGITVFDAAYGSGWAGLGACPINTKNGLRAAAVEYNANVTAAELEYGPIDNWDVSGVTDMSGLFYKLKNF